MGNRYFLTQPLPEPAGSDSPEALDSSLPTVTLEGEEAHHLLRVLRAERGTEVTLFDGSGDEFEAVVEETSRRTAQLRVISRKRVDRETAVPLHLAVALPKGDRQRWLVEKLVELGVWSLVPILTRRGVAQPTPKALERLKRYVIEASKQCGRNRLMQIETPCEWSRLLDAAPRDATRLVAHPADKTPSADATASSEDGPRSGEAAPTWAAVGPEGGFTDEEVQAALAAGWQPIDLGPRILRVETAAVALAVVLEAGR